MSCSDKSLDIVVLPPPVDATSISRLRINCDHQLRIEVYGSKNQNCTEFLKSLSRIGKSRETPKTMLV